MTNNLSIDLSNRHSTHLVRFTKDLVDAGWIAIQFPAEAKLLPNRQLVELRAPKRTIRLRISIYKVSDRGEPHRLDERRIEITTTFANGLQPLTDFADIVLGYDPVNDAYVGLDARRLKLGGVTHNASSSVEPNALKSASNSQILIRPHQTPSLGLEYQAIFQPKRLSEYLFNSDAIHNGLYKSDGIFSGDFQTTKSLEIWQLPVAKCKGHILTMSHTKPAAPKILKVSIALVKAFEVDDGPALSNLSPEELEAILRKCRLVGDAGEQHVYQQERKRLHKAGRSDLVAKIDWVSRKFVGRGYDIRSFESDGSPRFIEVKATIGNSQTFFMSNNEWRMASKLGNAYYVYRVVAALEKPATAAILRDPVEGETASKLKRVPEGWRVTIL